MAKKRKAFDIEWEAFLEDPKAVDALIEFIEGELNNRQLWSRCRTEACKTQVDRMRVLNNAKSRQQAERFLRRHYTW